jgi:hypothetical protein
MILFLEILALEEVLRLEHQQVGLRQGPQQFSIAPVAFRYGQFLEKSGKTEVERHQAFKNQQDPKKHSACTQQKFFLN